MTIRARLLAIAFIALVLTVVGAPKNADAAPSIADTLTSNECDLQFAVGAAKSCFSTAVNAGTGYSAAANATPSPYIGARSDSGDATGALDVWGVCRYVDNISINNTSLFVPFNTAMEWNAFVANAAKKNALELVHCVRPQTSGLSVSPSSFCKGAVPLPVSEQSYYRFPYTWQPHEQFTCDPTQADGGGSWTETAVASFVGQDADSVTNGVNWVPSTTTYTENEPATCGLAQDSKNVSQPGTTAGNLCKYGVVSGMSSSGPPWTWSCTTGNSVTPSVSCSTAAAITCSAAMETWTGADGLLTCSSAVMSPPLTASPQGTAPFSTPTSSTNVGSATFVCDADGIFTQEPGATCVAGATPVPPPAPPIPAAFCTDATSWGTAQMLKATWLGYSSPGSVGNSGSPGGSLVVTPPGSSLAATDSRTDTNTVYTITLIGAGGHGGYASYGQGASVGGYVTCYISYGSGGGGGAYISFQVSGVASASDITLSSNGSATISIGSPPVLYTITAGAGSSGVTPTVGASPANAGKKAAGGFIIVTVKSGTPATTVSYTGITSGGITTNPDGSISVVASVGNQPSSSYNALPNNFKILDYAPGQPGLPAYNGPASATDSSSAAQLSAGGIPYNHGTSSCTNDGQGGSYYSNDDVAFSSYEGGVRYSTNQSPIGANQGVKVGTPGLPGVVPPANCSGMLFGMGGDSYPGNALQLTQEQQQNDTDWTGTSGIALMTWGNPAGGCEPLSKTGANAPLNVYEWGENVNPTYSGWFGITPANAPATGVMSKTCGTKTPCTSGVVTKTLTCSPDSHPSYIPPSDVRLWPFTDSSWSFGY